MPSSTTNDRRALAVLLACPFMAQADATIANVATPAIGADLGATGAALELVIGGYLIAFAVLLITGARLGQTHGYRRMLMIGVATFGLASLLCGLATGPGMLIGARVLQGAGAALMFPQALSGIQRTFTDDERMRAIGLYALALSGGAVSGQILGGVLVSGIGWRAIFLVNVPVAAIALAGAARRLPRDDERADTPVDAAGVLVLTASVLLVTLPLVLGRSAGWPAWTWLCLVAGAGCALAFVALERRVASRGGAPLVSVALFARPQVSWALGALLSATGTYYALMFTLAQYLQTGLGHSALVSGLTLAPWVAAFGLAGQFVRRLEGRVLAAAPAAGCLLLAAAYAAIAACVLGGHRSEALLVPLLAVGGLGLGVQFSALIRHLTDVVAPRYAPDISGVSTTTMQIGGSLGVAGFGTLYVGHATTPGDAFALVTAGLAAVALAATAAAYRATHDSAATTSSKNASMRSGV